MTRSNARELAVHFIYAMECSGATAEQTLASRLEAESFAQLAEENELYAELPGGRFRSYIVRVVTGVEEQRQALDAMIEAYSERWSLSRISSLARAIMELAMYEALYVEDVPMNVAIHEAVLLAKKYEEADTVSYVNGVLGAFSRAQAQPGGDAPC